MNTDLGISFSFCYLSEAKDLKAVEKLEKYHFVILSAARTSFFN